MKFLETAFLLGAGGVLGTKLFNKAVHRAIFGVGQGRDEARMLLSGIPGP